jgi:hypothetical protein
MNLASDQIALPKNLLQEAARHADHLGVSVEQWIEVTLSERLRLEEQTAAFFRERASRASGRSLMEILDKAPNNPPMPGDEL